MGGFQGASVRTVANASHPCDILSMCLARGEQVNSMGHRSRLDSAGPTGPDDWNGGWEVSVSRYDFVLGLVWGGVDVRERQEGGEAEKTETGERRP